MFCQKCGKQLNEGAAFCDGCGNRQEVQSVPQTKTSLMTNSNKKTNANVLSLIGGMMLLLFVILQIPDFISSIIRSMKYFVEYPLQVFLQVIPIVLHLAEYVFISVLLLLRKNNKLLGVASSILLATCIYDTISTLNRFLRYQDLIKNESEVKEYMLTNIEKYKSSLIIGFIFLLFIALLVFSIFFKDKTKLTKLTPIYILLPVLMFVWEMVNYQLVKKEVQFGHSMYYYNYVVNYAMFFRHLFLHIGLMFTGLHIIYTDKEITENELEKHKKIYSVGVAGLICFFASLLVAILIIAISSLIWDEIYFFNGYFFTGILWVLAIVAFLFGMITMPLFFISIKYINKIQMQNAEQGILTDGYINMTKHILLLLFTFGIWQYIWIHRTTAYLNRTPNAEKYNPATKLLLCMFVPFYSIYWTYKHAQRVDTLLKMKNPAHSDIATTFLIISIFIPVVAYIMTQDKINTIAKNEAPPVYRSSPVNAPPPKTEESTFTHLEEVKRLKELFDTGVITQEEFDAKKKQILNL